MVRAVEYTTSMGGIERNWRTSRVSIHDEHSERIQLLVDAYGKVDPGVDLRDIYRHDHLMAMLEVVEPTALVKQLQGAKEEFQSTMEGMKRTSLEEWDLLASTGFAFVRGQTMAGEPVIWLDESRIMPRKLAHSEVYIYFMVWVVLWAIRLCPPGVSGFVLMSYDRNRSNIDTPLGAYNRVMKAFMQLCGPRLMFISKVCYVCPKLVTRVIVRFMRKVIGQSERGSWFDMVEKESDLRDKLVDARCIPEWIDSEQGMRFEADKRSVGDFRSFIRDHGDTVQSMAYFFNPPSTPIITISRDLLALPSAQSTQDSNELINEVRSDVDVSPNCSYSELDEIEVDSKVGFW
eukprot:CAMPEP_0184687782 /NCGR_PEP_ID=MMETSP0312-20130426/27538_1 /TAXON_ID=31354 /ORGANISM="Compsopogon coeruleus, Strain SAG 36.94" /LENGTH=346 /DNA_ID=CAMNT_0027144267 /DNA_START=101 /DNA_END=1138 /DNA_ORIENTATION=-